MGYLSRGVVGKQESTVVRENYDFCLISADCDISKRNAALRCVQLFPWRDYWIIRDAIWVDENWVLFMCACVCVRVCVCVCVLFKMYVLIRLLFFFSLLYSLLSLLLSPCPLSLSLPPAFSPSQSHFFPICSHCILDRTCKQS